MLDFSQYINTDPKPTKRDFTTRYYYSGGKLIHTSMGGEDAPAHIRCGGHGAMETVFDDIAYTNALLAWSAKSKELTEAFRRDVFTELGITDHPKRARLFELAWDMCHAAGLDAVYYCASDLTDLLDK